MWVGRLQLGKPLLDQSLNVGTSATAVQKPTVPHSFRNVEMHRGHYAVHVIMFRYIGDVKGQRLSNESDKEQVGGAEEKQRFVVAAAFIRIDTTGHEPNGAPSPSLKL